MREKSPRPFLVGLLLFQVCFTMFVSVTMYIFSRQLQDLRNVVETLRTTASAVDAGNPMGAAFPGETEDHSKGKSHSKRAAIDGQSLFHDLIVAQENILASHCKNDSRLCMKGPKGDKGDRGDPGPPAPTSTPIVTKCECLEKPAVTITTTTTSPTSVLLNCTARGSPAPYIVLYGGSGKLSSNKDTEAAYVTYQTPVKSSSGTNYRCVARNLHGEKSTSITV